jgi:lipid II:glycine glycyltransferase (peptidoglycan interpeptide bridge formation enzyme)
MPNYLMQWEMIRWAVETGCEVYDFQGVSGILEEGAHMYGLYQFKRGFNGQLDELAGEFNYVFRPVAVHLVDAALGTKTQLGKLKARLRGRN